MRIVTIGHGSAGADGGLHPGDLIVSIDGKSFRGANLDEGIASIQGDIGASVTLRGQPPFNLQLVRRAQSGSPIEARMLDGIGYVPVSSLHGGAAMQVSNAVGALRAQAPHMRGLILDLRGCPGGLLTESVGVAKLFIEHGVIVTEQGRDPRDVERYQADGRDIVAGLPMVVLIDSGTAAGCEFIAAALQDNGRAKLLGLTSFGAGSVQTVIPINRGLDRRSRSPPRCISGRAVSRFNRSA